MKYMDICRTNSVNILDYKDFKRFFIKTKDATDENCF